MSSGLDLGLVVGQTLMRITYAEKVSRRIRQHVPN